MRTCVFLGNLPMLPPNSRPPKARIERNCDNRHNRLSECIRIILPTIRSGQVAWIGRDRFKTGTGPLEFRGLIHVLNCLQGKSVQSTHPLGEGA